LKNNKLFYYSLLITLLFFSLSVIFMFGIKRFKIERNFLDAFFCFTVFFTFFLGLKDLFRGLEKGKAHLYTGSILSGILGIAMLLMYVAEILKNFIEKSSIHFNPGNDLIIILVSSVLTIPGFLAFRGRKIHH